ncbi:hypothetical protein K2173_025525 [Erythroxylum novogranatense]|uniref:Thioredoxin domain-containing protein n=1 Tax=Erythroxylum novogranatense TaxID=1862640 RepID=A0AAV8TAA5_9ROSI|nr:hypothetical protein K2173_025525 [Erythroxylum novogranatense]
MALLPFVILYFGALSSPGLVSASASAPTCPRVSTFSPHHLQSQCFLSIPPSPVLEVNGNILDWTLTSIKGNAYTSVLFYASWCPFSRDIRPKFELLSSMFPQMEHLAIEESSAVPSIFSRYGIHSLPSILLVNQTSRVRYHGPKDLQSLVQFYEKTTGLEPIHYLVEDRPRSLDVGEKSIMQPWNVSSLDEIMKKEPYLLFAALFLCFRMLLLVFPKVLSHVKALWGSYVLHLNLEIFGETSQLFGRTLDMIDVRRIWTKLRLCKTRNFQEGAKNCRVWASSLASVALGESSSSSGRS